MSTAQVINVDPAKAQTEPQLLAKNDQILAAIGVQLLEELTTRVEILIESPESGSTLPERVDALEAKLEELSGTVDDLPDPYECAAGVVEDNGEGFVREDDMPDQILNHVGETLDKDQIVELIKSVVGTVLGKVEIRLSYGDSFDAYLHRDKTE
tara:strand:+ start:3589 stop:4050 length:462 start_codon:yes stop_codon:yes gene_type:complete